MRKTFNSKHNRISKGTFMSTTPLTCIARFVALPQQINALKTALQAMIEPTCAESGCISYRLYQSAENPAAFTLIEHFQNQAAFDLHSQQPYLAALTTQLPTLAQSVTIETYHPCA